MSIAVERHPSAEAFLHRAGPWLLKAEAEHNLVLGLAAALKKGNAAGFEPPMYFATVEHRGEVAGCAFRTPPFKLGLTRMPKEAIAPVAVDVAEVYSDLPAVLGPEREARSFAAVWSRRQDVTVREGMRQRIYQLETVRAPEALPPGRLRAAQPNEVDLVAGWIEAFQDEVKIQPVDARRKAEFRIGAGDLFIWDHGQPRTMAAVVARTPNGARIGYVYTPPEWRGRGYASACTTRLSERVLESGARFCFLYTDRSNATSNALYARIGYRAVSDIGDYVFEQRSS